MSSETYIRAEHAEQGHARCIAADVLYPTFRATAVSRVFPRASSLPPPPSPHLAPSNPATKAYATLGYGVADVSPPPDVFITSDLCSRGKPHPEPYQLGAKSLDVDAARCLVVEDAPPGVESGKAAGAKVLGLRTTHAGERMWGRGADFVVEDLRMVHARWDGDRLLLDIDSEDRPAAAAAAAAAG